jgi:hypothetical protein
MSVRRTYGPSIPPRAMIARVFGVTLDGRVPAPPLDPGPPEEAPDARLSLARKILIDGPPAERYRLVADELARMRPLEPAYRNLILDYVRTFEFRGNGHYQMMPYIAWLAAGDPELGPPVAAYYVERAFTGPNNRKFARYLAFFGRELLAPHAQRLLAVYAGPYSTTNASDIWRNELSVGIGQLGPDVADIMIKEFDGLSRDGKRAPSAAVALCRAGDARAAEPLLRKLKGFESAPDQPYPMSYAYALARLGRGAEAQRIVAHMRGPDAADRQCLDEIVATYPNGGAPDSICLMEGPAPGPVTQWQSDLAAVTCLAPRTPAPTE